MDLPTHIGALPIAALHGLIGDVTKIALCLSLAYLVYGIAHILVDRLEHKEGQPFRFWRRLFRAVIYFLLLLMSALHAVEYMIGVAQTA